VGRDYLLGNIAPTLLKSPPGGLANGLFFRVLKPITSTPKQRSRPQWPLERHSLLDMNLLESGLEGSQHDVLRINPRHTLSDIPTEVPNTIESVESERCSQNDLGGILGCFGKPRDELQYVDGVKGSRSSKIGQEVAVHYCHWSGAEG